MLGMHALMGHAAAVCEGKGLSWRCPNVASPPRTLLSTPCCCFFCCDCFAMHCTTDTEVTREKYHISKYPTIKIFRKGIALKAEYRGQVGRIDEHELVLLGICNYLPNVRIPLLARTGVAVWQLVSLIHNGSPTCICLRSTTAFAPRNGGIHQRVASDSCCSRYDGR